MKTEAVVGRKPTHPKRPSPTKGTRILITSLSVAATLGAWQLLARQEGIAGGGEQTVQAARQESTVSSVPPLPTLVPPLPEQVLSGPAENTQSQTRLLLGGAKPQPARPAPVARTGSSR